MLSNIYYLLGQNWSQNQKWREYIEIRKVWYLINNVNLLVYLRRGVLVIYEIINSRDFWRYFHKNLTCFFVDDVNCTDFFAWYSYVHFLKNAWTCSYERLNDSNYYLLRVSNFAKRQLLHFLIGNKSRFSALKVACIIMRVRAQSCLTVA